MTNETEPKVDKIQHWEMPFPDFKKLLETYKIPGVDFAALMDHEKRNIEALTKANKIAFEGWQALGRRQSEILQETMKEAVANARNEDTAKHRSELAKESFEKAFDHMRELAEIVTKSQNEALEVVRKRAGENIERLKNFGKDK